MKIWKYQIFNIFNPNKEIKTTKDVILTEIPKLLVDFAIQPHRLAVQFNRPITELDLIVVS